MDLHSTGTLDSNWKRISKFFNSDHAWLAPAALHAPTDILHFFLIIRNSLTPNKHQHSKTSYVVSADIFRHFSEKHIILSFVITFSLYSNLFLMVVQVFLLLRWRNNESCFDCFCMFWKIKWFHRVTYEACILCIIDYMHMLVYYMTAFPQKSRKRESKERRRTFTTIVCYSTPE